jgi:hypothetical protein
MKKRNLNEVQIISKFSEKARPKKIKFAEEEIKSTSLAENPNTLFLTQQPSPVFLNFNLATTFLKVYKDALHPAPNWENGEKIQYSGEEKKIAVAKLASYAVIEELANVEKNETVKISCFGRAIFIHPDHEKILTTPDIDNSVARLQFALIENAAGHRVLIDLGARNPTQLVYELRCCVDATYKATQSWFQGIANTVIENLGNNEGEKYTKICPLYAEIKAAVVATVSRSFLGSEEMPSNLRPKDVSPNSNIETGIKKHPYKENVVILATSDKGIGWWPVPSGYEYEIKMGNCKCALKAEEQLNEEDAPTPLSSPTK